MPIRRASLSLVLACIPALVRGAFFDAAVTPGAGDQFRTADYRLWVPDDVGRLRAVIIRQHGCGTGAARYGLSHPHDPQWQALARRHRAALLGTRIIPRQACQDWYDLEGGSDAALLSALADLATRSEHPELETVPWVLFGHSGGAAWTANMVARYPRRVIAAVPARGRLPLSQAASAANVPILWAQGARDDLILRSLKAYPDFRQPGNGLWALAIEPTGGHELGNLRWMALPYLDALLSLRLPRTGDALRPVEARTGWYGDNQTHAIAPAHRFSGDPTRASWLPSELLARRWQEYVTTGSNAPTRLPGVARELEAIRRSPTEVEVRWASPIDLENPPPSFRVYRDGTLVGTVPALRHGHGDNPEPIHSAPVFRDARVPAGNRPVYAVTAVLGDREGPRSRRVRPPLRPGPEGRSARGEALPDLVVTELVTVPPVPQTGESVTFRATLKNVGSAPTPEGTLLALTFSLNGRWVGWGDVRAPLAAGATAEAFCGGVPGEGVWRAATGRFEAGVVVDDLDRVPEGDESNNRFVQGITVPATPPGAPASR